MRDSGAAVRAGRAARARLGGARSRGSRRLRRQRLVGPVGRLDVHRRLGRAAVAALLEVGEHVLLAHAPAAAGALDLLEVEVVLRGHARDHGRVAAAPPRGAAWRGASGPRVRAACSAAVSPCSSPGCRPARSSATLAASASAARASVASRRPPPDVRLAGLRVGRDAREHGADLDRLAHRHEDLLHPPGRRRLHVRVDLVRGDRRDDLVGLAPSRRAACATRRPCPRRRRRPSGAS